MSTLKFAEVHNMVAFISNPTESEGFKQIIDFLNAHSVKYALMINPTIYTSCIEQFWATAKMKNINREAQLHAKLDGKKVVISEASIRRDLYAKTTAWNEFSSTMAFVVICLATNQKFNFSKYIFDSIKKNLDSRNKFLLYPRFVQVFLKNQLEEMENHTRIYVTPSHTKKIFSNMRKVGKDFSGRETPLFPTMMVQAQEEIDEDVNEEMDDSLERATTTATSLDAEQDMGGGPRCQEAMRDTSAHTRRGKKLEKKHMSRTHKLKRLYKVGLTARVISSSNDEALDKKDTSKQRRIDEIDADEYITLVSTHDGELQDKGIKDIGEEEVVEVVTTAKMLIDTVVDVAQVTTAIVDVPDSDAEIIVTTALTITAESTNKNVKVPQRKHQIKADEELAKQLQAKIDEENRIAREKAQKVEETKLFMGFLEKRRKFFAAKRAEENRNRPPTKAQQRSLMCIYLKNMDGWKPRSLRNKSFAKIQELFDKAMKRINTFIDFRTELVVESTKKDKAEIVQESSSKRTGDKLEQKRSKKKKMENDKESVELKKCLEIISDDGDEVTIDATPLSSNKLLKNFDREDLEVLWRLVKDRFVRTKTVDDMYSFLLHTLKTMFEHHVEDNVWKNQQRLTKVKSWKLFDSYRVHYVTMQNTLYYLLVEKMYPLTHHTLDQIFNNVKLQVDYECEMAYKLLILVKKQIKE
nr:hypothetical protein [Tanacetum cinerariifolium]